MGEISPKLRKVLEMVKPDVQIPVIVKLSVPLTKEVISNLEGLGFTVKEQIPTVNMVSGKIQAKLVEQLASLPIVAKVSYDEPVTIQSEPFFRIAGKESVRVPVSGATTGRVMGVDSVWFQYGYTGKGIKVAVLDTGVSTNHPMLEDAIYKAESMVEGEDVTDHHGHGTWCAGCILGRPYEGMLEDRMYEVTGMAPEADLIAIKVLSNDGSGQTSWVIKGMERAAELGADIISMSLGSMVSEAGRSPDSEMVDALSGKGILCIVAAGNSALPLSIGSPGDARGSITVGSVAYQLPTPLIPSTFSSRGPTVDLRIKPTVSTFGGNVLPEMTELLVSAGTGTSLKALAGTSMATPHISGITALMLQAGLPRDRDILEFVFSRVGTKRVPIPFKDTDYGWGVPNVFKAISERVWNQPEAESFNILSERLQEVTMPISTMLEPVTVKMAQLMGVEMTPRLAVIS